MNEYRENTPEKIDITELLFDGWKAIKRFWWLIIGLTVAFGLKEYVSVTSNYVPQYVASATTAVRCVGNDRDYVNSETAKQMAEIFPYIMESGVLQNAIAEDMGVEVIPGTISMSVEEGTSFFTVSANANDPQVAYNLLQATLRHYPEVAKFVIGQIEMDVLDETGIPEDTGREYTVRGSVKDGAIKGAIIGLGIIAVYVLTRKTVKSRKELKNTVNLSDCGSIPFVALKKRKKKGVNVAVNLKNERVSRVYLEAVRKLRIKVMKEMEQREFHSLLVTSSIPGEGKTTIASNLALTIAKQGKHVILVDCDPRNPSVASVMDEKEVHPGIGAVLKNQVSLKEALTEEEISGGRLQILYGGKPDTSVAKLLGTKQMEALIKVLERQADIVILDTAPAELLADASALAKYVDAALYVVKQDYAKKGQIRNGVQALSMSGIEIIGSVFNADKSRKSGGYGYGYGYKNYGSYYGYGYGYYGNRKKDDLSGRVIKD